MRFLTITLIAAAPDPVTGAVTPTTERFAQVADSALLAEELGFDGFGVGERHERPFISSSPPVLRRDIADPPWPWAPVTAAGPAPAHPAPADPAPAAR